jgi:hypothetical protein
VNDLRVYRGNADFVKKEGVRKGFHTGGNSSCRQHIRQHYKLYQERCKEADIPENHWAVPRKIWNARQAAINNPKRLKEQTQVKLDGMFEKSNQTQGFTRDKVLRAVAQFIACDDQASPEWLEAGGLLTCPRR